MELLLSQCSQSKPLFVCALSRVSLFFTFETTWKRVEIRDNAGQRWTKLDNTLRIKSPYFHLKTWHNPGYNLKAWPVKSQLTQDHTLIESVNLQRALPREVRRPGQIFLYKARNSSYRWTNVRLTAKTYRFMGYYNRICFVCTNTHWSDRPLGVRTVRQHSSPLCDFNLSRGLRVLVRNIVVNATLLPYVKMAVQIF
jgi:hypothetical protein